MDTLLLLIIVGLLWRNWSQSGTCRCACSLPETPTWEPFASPERQISQLTDQAVLAMLDEARRQFPRLLP